MVEKKMKFHSSGCAKAVKSRSIDCKDLLGQLCRYGPHRSEMATVDDSESLSDIDDEELCRYLNSKEEARCKKALWEEINRDQTKSTKRAAEGKKVGPVRKASKVTDEAETEKAKPGNGKKRSSKINYDALEKLEAELELLGNANKESESPRSSCNSLSNVALSSERQDCDDAFAQGTEYGEDATYGDEYNGDRDEDYSYDEGFYDED